MSTLMDYLAIAIVIGALIGIIPMIFGVIRQQVNRGMLGLGACILGSALGAILFSPLLSILIVVPVSGYFSWLIVSTSSK